MITILLQNYASRRPTNELGVISCYITEQYAISSYLHILTVPASLPFSVWKKPENGTTWVSTEVVLL